MNSSNSWCAEPCRALSTSAGWRRCCTSTPPSRDAKEPYVLDVIVPYTEHVLPFIPAGKTVADMIWKA
jgi:hypothetical protein